MRHVNVWHGKGDGNFRVKNFAYCSLLFIVRCLFVAHFLLLPIVYCSLVTKSGLRYQLLVVLSERLLLVKKPSLQNMNRIVLKFYGCLQSFLAFEFSRSKDQRRRSNILQFKRVEVFSDFPACLQFGQLLERWGAKEHARVSSGGCFWKPLLKAADYRAN